jgi:hypothetical protein
MTREHERLEEHRGGRRDWKQWGPYLADRAWGTVREDYSPDGTAWEYFPHDHARSRAYRWNEDGLAGICDRRQVLCFALALWNGRDPILKERLFGLTTNEGRHGEDVKEYGFHVDATPTHSYLKYLYKYPQRAFPYQQLIDGNAQRSRNDPEYELLDTGIFDDNRYFDVIVEYAKDAPDDLGIRVTVHNRGPRPADVDVLPTIWFRNTWSWGLDARQPRLEAADDLPGARVIGVHHFELPDYLLLCDGSPQLLFTNNETNFARLFGAENRERWVKDGINDYIVSGTAAAVNPAQHGTKACARYRVRVAPGGCETIRLRLSTSARHDTRGDGAPFATLDELFATRIREADEFFDAVAPEGAPEDVRRVQRQAFAGLVWSKQFYHYDLRRWLRGDPAGPEPPRQRLSGRNTEWTNIYNADIISMPDKWEFPWYAAWDLAFHCIPLALIDPEFAKEQLLLLLRERYMHPNGQLPAYEWGFSDVNPPVHAWGAWRVYRIEERLFGRRDRVFLERVFHKLLLNFTWWVNRKDAGGNNIFQGGFLGLDNIGAFDRSMLLPGGGNVEQADATSWMAMYCLNMMTIALELSRENPAYEDVASKFLEHFVYISRAMNNIGEKGLQLWDERDGFYYDAVRLEHGPSFPLRLRSMVGLIPLFAVETLDSELIDTLPSFKRRMQWFVENLPEFSACIETQSTALNFRRFFALIGRDRLERVLKVMLDEREFLSEYGIRSLSRYHLDHPYSIRLDSSDYRVTYEPAESRTERFGGNSNWRGPIWFPVNFLIIESLQKFHYYLGDQFRVECPTGSGRLMNLWEVSLELERRLLAIFLRDRNDQRPVFNGRDRFQSDPHWRDLILFHEYFHGDNGTGLGASHQTGWTALVAKLIDQSYRAARAAQSGSTP